MLNLSDSSWSDLITVLGSTIFYHSGCVIVAVLLSLPMRKDRFDSRNEVQYNAVRNC